MAKVLFSGVAGVDIRNKLNGSVFSKNRAGAYIRTKVTPVNPQTDAQQQARNNLSTNSQAWRGLTESQRQGWIDGAVNFPYTDIYGQTKILSGQQLFVKLNNNLVNAGASGISVCPSPIALPAIASITLTAAQTAGVVSLAYDVPEGTSDFILVVEATPNVTPGKMFVKNLYRFLNSVGTDAASPFVLTSSYAAKFGAPVEGQKIFMRVRIVSAITGQSGIPLQTMDIVAS